MARKTIQQLENELDTVKKAKEEAENNYNSLLEQAQQLQGLASNRLVFIRLLEGFANEVNQSLQKLQRDLMELQRGPTDEEGVEV
tara:strand:+ start:865 stop:1119 length:255 start_codon:yes stop_codon:yes gene_type:complete